MKKGLYRHFKGNLYRVLGEARHSETEEILVLYQRADKPDEFWVRPKVMFLETVTHQGVEQPRFQWIEE